MASKKLTQAEKIALKLRKMIILKELHAGERINQEMVSKRFGVSKIPLREALKILEAEGLVVSEPYKGSFVGHITTDYIQETFFLRSVLEGISCSQATPRFDEQSLFNLEQILVRTDEVLRKKDYEHFIRCAEAFHDYIHEFSGYKRLTLMIHNLNTRSLVLNINPKEQCQKSLDEHVFIFEKIRKKDPEGAGNAMRMHLQRAGMDAVREWTKTRGAQVK